MITQTLQFLSVQHENADPIRIAYEYWPHQASSATFMWFSGFKSDMQSQKAQALAGWAKTKGAGSLLFDYSGHGVSEGKFEDGTIGKWLAEGERVYREVTKAGENVVFVGSSMGGWIALLLALRLQRQGLKAPKALVLIAPAWDMTRLIWDKASSQVQAEITEKGRYAYPSPYSDEPTVITKALIDDGVQYLFGPEPVAIPCPIRILQGVMDPDVPCAHVLELLTRLSEPDCRITLIKDGEHRLSRPQDIALLFSTCAEFLGDRSEAK